MLFTLTSLTNFPSAQLNTAVCLCCLPKTWECWDGGGIDGAIMAVRPGTGEFQPELLQADAVQQSTLNTMTPPCAIGCVCTHATICAAPPARGERAPQLPSWRSGLTGAL